MHALTIGVYVIPKMVLGCGYFAHLRACVVEKHNMNQL
jgi:hypothetical protein